MSETVYNMNLAHFSPESCENPSHGISRKYYLRGHIPFKISKISIYRQNLVYLKANLFPFFLNKPHENIPITRPLINKKQNRN